MSERLVYQKILREPEEQENLVHWQGVKPENQAFGDGLDAGLSSQDIQSSYCQYLTGLDKINVNGWAGRDCQQSGGHFKQESKRSSALKTELLK